VKKGAKDKGDKGGKRVNGKKGKREKGARGRELSPCRPFPPFPFTLSPFPPFPDLSVPARVGTIPFSIPLTSILSKEGTQYEGARITLRPAQPEDEPFLYELYSSTRTEEISAWGLDPAQQETFLRLQFRGQQSHFRMQALDVDYRIILRDDRPIGQLIVIRSDREIRLADISLLPEHRGAGIGASLIFDLFDEAKEKRMPVTLHVEKTNRAARLYQRLGFIVTGDTGAHLKMEWQPQI
jgi:ribosomal protein S18 acetylase RimI-like enzyme